MNITGIVCAVSLVVLLALASTGLALPLFEETDVFVGGLDDVNTYRIPSLICTKNGAVLAFAEGRRDSSTDGSPTHLVLKRSLGNTMPFRPPTRRGPVPDTRTRRLNMTWQPMQILIPTDGETAYMNPVPVIDQSDGTVFVLVDYHGRRTGEERRRGVYVLKSTDEGATWSEPRDIGDSVGRKALGPGVGIQTKTGRLVVPVYDGVIYSDDHGKTWQAGGKTTGPVSETQVVELTDGALMLNTRSTPNRTIVTSTDGGLSWGKPWTDQTLTDSNVYDGCQGSVIRYTAKSDGYTKDRLLFANPADPKHRFKMTVRMSYDEGKTWPVSKLIKDGTGAYSCLTVMPDGSIGLIYETGNKYADIDIVEYYAKLAFARFNIEWLTDGKDALDKSTPATSPAETQQTPK